MNGGPENPAFGFTVPDDRDRLAELGRIAGSLVHELKNPVGVILLNAELMQNQISQALPPAEREREQKRLRRIVDAARSVQGIVQSFLAFARPGQPDPDAVDVNTLLADLLEEQKDALDAAQVHVSFHPDEQLALLAADKLHLRSVFQNIITNAREALAGRPDDRRLLVVTRSAPQLVRIVIANNGPPFDERVAAHLFEPFMSSKDDGTGLGLAIVRRLVELHHGTVTASSDKAQGVSFTLEFPTELGPAKARTELPLPTVEASIREEACDMRRAKRDVPSTATPSADHRTSAPTKSRKSKRTSHLAPRTSHGKK